MTFKPNMLKDLDALQKCNAVLEDILERTEILKRISGKGRPIVERIWREDLIEVLVRNGYLRRRDIVKASEDAKKYCAYDKKISAEEIDKIVDEIKAIAEDSSNPLHQFVVFESLETEKVFKDADGNWLPERQKAHEKAIQDIFSGATKAKDRGERPVLCMTGGGSASGKGWCTEEFDREGRSRSVTRGVIDADEIKKQFIPEYQKLSSLKIASAAAQAHEESSVIAGGALNYALANGYDVVYDATLKSTGKAFGIVDKAKGYGYNVYVKGMFVDPVEAFCRSTERGLKTGRVVPKKIIIAAHKGFSSTFPELVKRLNFADGDHAELFNNDVPVGAPPILVYKDGNVINRELWDRFLKIKDLNF